MATCRQIIKDARRALYGEGYDNEPSAAEASAGLASLVGLYGHWIATGKFGKLTDVIASGAYEASEGERVSGGTVTLPTTITEDGVTRTPKDKSVVVVAGATPQLNLYDADLGAWVDTAALELDDTAPFSARLSLGLAALLAVAISDEAGVSVPVPPATQLKAKEAARALFKRDPVTVRVPNALLFLSRQTNRINQPSE